MKKVAIGVGGACPRAPIKSDERVLSMTGKSKIDSAYMSIPGDKYCREFCEHNKGEEDNKILCNCEY